MLGNLYSIASSIEKCNELSLDFSILCSAYDSESYQLHNINFHFFYFCTLHVFSDLESIEASGVIVSITPPNALVFRALTPPYCGDIGHCGRSLLGLGLARVVEQHLPIGSDDLDHIGRPVLERHHLTAEGVDDRLGQGVLGRLRVLALLEARVEVVDLSAHLLQIRVQRVERIPVLVEEIRLDDDVLLQAVEVGLAHLAADVGLELRDVGLGRLDTGEGEVGIGLAVDVLLELVDALRLDVAVHVRLVDEREDEGEDRQHPDHRTEHPDELLARLGLDCVGRRGGRAGRRVGQVGRRGGRRVGRRGRVLRGGGRVGRTLRRRVGRGGLGGGILRRRLSRGDRVGDRGDRVLRDVVTRTSEVGRVGRLGFDVVDGVDDLVDG